MPLCDNLDEQNKEGGYWETGITFSKSHISMCPACHPLLAGFLSHQRFVDIVGVLITRLRPCRCNYFVVYLCLEENRHQSSDNTGEPVCYQYNFGFQAIFGAPI